MHPDKNNFSVSFCFWTIAVSVAAFVFISGWFTSGFAVAAGADVKQAQQQLKTLGYDPGPADGVMGQKTVNAVRCFQLDRGLPVTGRLDRATADTLGLDQGRSVRMVGHKSGRHALLVGNSAYRNGGGLKNPVNDVSAMAKVLDVLGFEVKKLTDCTQNEMRKAMDEFGLRMKNQEVGLFFYAGHGVQVGGKNYLVPVDCCRMDYPNQVDYNCVDVGRLLANMENAGARTNIVILDACRDNPFRRSWSRGSQDKGLAFMNAPSGSFIAYATSPGRTAADGSGTNGLYTSALLKYIAAPGIKIEDVFKKVRIDVRRQSNGGQTPWESTSLQGDFYFAAVGNSPAVFRWGIPLGMDAVMKNLCIRYAWTDSGWGGMR